MLIVIIFIDINITAVIISAANQVFIYPDMKTAISGTFSGSERLIEGCQCEVLPD